MDEEPGPESLREAVLETLLQLHVDFAALGALEEAGPMLHKLMEVAYHRKLRSEADWGVTGAKRGVVKRELH